MGKLSTKYVLRKSIWIGKRDGRAAENSISPDFHPSKADVQMAQRPYEATWTDYKKYSSGGRYKSSTQVKMKPTAPKTQAIRFHLQTKPALQLDRKAGPLDRALRALQSR